MTALPRVSTFPRDLRALAAEYGFNDSASRGELNQLFDSRYTAKRYLRPDGVTLDSFGEIVMDRGLVTERPTVNEVLEFLATVFDGRDDIRGSRETRRKGARTGKREATSAIETEALRAKNARSKKFECETCRGRAVKCNAAVSTFSGICGRCFLESVSPSAIEAMREAGAVITFLTRADRTFDEVMRDAAGIDSTPF